METTPGKPNEQTSVFAMTEEQNKLAEEIERHLAPDAIYSRWRPSMNDMRLIVEALREPAVRVPDWIVQRIGNTSTAIRKRDSWALAQVTDCGNGVFNGTTDGTDAGRAAYAELCKLAASPDEQKG